MVYVRALLFHVFVNSYASVMQQQIVDHLLSIIVINLTIKQFQ